MTRRPRPTFLVALIAVIVVTACVAPAGAQGHDPAHTPRPTALDALSARAQRDGTVRVIVGIDVPVTPEGTLSRAQVTAQRRRVDQARDHLLAMLASSEVELVRQFETIPFMTVEATAGGLEALAGSGAITSIDEDHWFAPSLAESIPRIKADAAWTTGYTGAGQTIAVLDTGVDKTHPFLAGKVIGEACFSILGSCPNGQVSQVGGGAGVPCTFSPSCAHGTHVAGIAAGANGAEGISGVAKDATVMAINVFSNSAGSALSTTSDQIAALEYVLDRADSLDIAAVNLSLGGLGSSTFCDGVLSAEKAAIDNLRSIGIPTVIAAGNNGYTDQIAYPSCISSAVSVGASTDDDEVSGFTNRSFELRLLAPGGDGFSHNITSSVPGGAYASLFGTSMAAPHVAGAFAILKEKASDDTVGRLLTTLRETGAGLTASSQQFPRIDVYAAIRWLHGPYPDPGFSDVPAHHPFFIDIAWAAGEGVSTGFDDGTFHPRDPLSRQALVEHLYRLVGSPPGPYPDPDFRDVPPAHPSLQAISWAVAADVTGGFTDGTFRPDDPVRRQTLATFLHRLVGSPTGPFPDPHYLDLASQHPFATAIQWAAYHEITQGFDDGTFKPHAALSRQAAVAFLYRFEPNLISDRR